MQSLKMGCILRQLVFVIVYGLTFGCCKRQKPRPYEIERVINETQSIMWKCPECPFGQGLNVLCGTSINISVPIQCTDCVEGFTYSDSHGYAPCKNCQKCVENEQTSGWCSKDEDTTKCLRTCHKGFYWEELTASCVPCGDCCGDTFQREKQCQNVGLPITHQCRQTSIRCPHPTTVTVTHIKKQDSINHRDHEEKTNIFELVAIVVGALLVIIVIILIIIFAMWKMYGWQEAKNLLRRFFCFFCRSVHSNKELTFHFNNGVFDEGERESTSLRDSEIHLEEATDRMGPLKSVPPVVKRPGLLRLSSVPVDTCPKEKSVILRSHSHPGCLGKLSKEPMAENKPVTVPKKCLMEWIKKKKLEKGGYVAVSTEPDPADGAVPGPAADVQREEKPKALCPLKAAQKHQSTSTTELHHQPSITSVPEYFQNCLLSRNMGSIPIKFYRKICIKLDNPRDCLWDDYRMLGEAIGLEKGVVSCLGQTGKPTEKLLEKFDSQGGSSIRKFRGIVEKMGRDDIVCIINEWIVDEWNNSNKVNYSSTVVV